MHHLSASLEPTNEADRMTSVEKSRAEVSPGGRGRSRTAARRQRGLFRTVQRPPVVTEFQSDAIEIEHRPPPHVARLTLYCVVLLILTAIGWAAGSQVDMIVTAQGKLSTTRPN